MVTSTDGRGGLTRIHGPYAARPGRSPGRLQHPPDTADPDDAAVPNAEDGDPAHVQAGPIGTGAVPVPLGPPGIVLVRRAEQLGLEVGNPGEDLRPVAPDLLVADECPVGMHRLFAAVLGVEAGDEGVQVVVVLGVAESRKHLSHQDLASSGIRLAMGLHDGPVELTAKDSAGPGLSLRPSWGGTTAVTGGQSRCPTDTKPYSSTAVTCRARAAGPCMACKGSASRLRLKERSHRCGGRVSGCRQ
jgi:hypothetical protein